MECLVGKQENFEVDSLINREPVKMFLHGIKNDTNHILWWLEFCKSVEAQIQV